MGSITKNTGRHAMIQNAFLYSCKLCFQFTSLCYYMYHTGKKEIKKKRGGSKNLLLRDSYSDRPQNQLELRVNPSIHWTTWVSAYDLNLKEVYMHIPSLW